MPVEASAQADRSFLTSYILRGRDQRRLCLSKPIYEKDLGSVYFQSSGRLVKLLGRESVSNPNVALLELVKNSYDEDDRS